MRFRHRGHGVSRPVAGPVRFPPRRSGPTLPPVRCRHPVREERPVVRRPVGRACRSLRYPRPGTPLLPNPRAAVRRPCPRLRHGPRTSWVGVPPAPEPTDFAPRPGPDPARRCPSSRGDAHGFGLRPGLRALGATAEPGALRHFRPIGWREVLRVWGRRRWKPEKRRDMPLPASGDTIGGRSPRGTRPGASRPGRRRDRSGHPVTPGEDAGASRCRDPRDRPGASLGPSLRSDPAPTRSPPTRGRAKAPIVVRARIAAFSRACCYRLELPDRNRTPARCSGAALVETCPHRDPRRPSAGARRRSRTVPPGRGTGHPRG